MEVKEMKLADIKPYLKNPRKNDDAVEYVANSIKAFGFKQPIVIDRENVIVCGHTRYKASKKLHLDTVPVVIADDLSEEQIKAYRLADNKVAEKAEWDFDLLGDELGDIIDIDMSAFDFDFTPPDFDDVDDDDEKVNERERTNDAYNLAEFNEWESEGFYQMPTIQPVDFMPERITGFNYALSTDDTDQGIHFFIDDYQFERIWNSPDEYMERLGEFTCCLTPDFSLYMDMPIAMKIWNTYRSRLIGQLMQKHGIKVIPTVSWAEKETFTFCFDGLPKNATLAISSVGVMRDENAFKVWKDGTDEMIKRLTPKRILCYGSRPEYDFKGIDVTYFNNTNSDHMKGSKKK